MSFLRQQQIYPPIGALICTGGGPLSGFAPGLIGWMSLPPAIPWQVALPQSLPPLRRVTLFCYKESGRSMDFQRTANSELTGCLSRGVHPRSVSQGDYFSIGRTRVRCREAFPLGGEPAQEF